MSEHQPPAAPPPLNPQPAQQSRRGKIIRFAVLMVILCGLVVVAIVAGRTSATNAEVGECVERTGDNSLSMVECGDPAAQYKVVGRKENLKQYGNINVCDEFDDATDRYWEGEQGGEGFFLCLAPVKRP
ncbi:hypothetical protein JOF56_010257 [Kibdelosporangium banguiense]|uniref:Uncharacterized protein n=1 Tax=Kibdelosporangium banguiense TaxID=1365924 RepID=A0ABS4TZP4_9PSEU|nr:hypothetical protein [Kibdelosporangium banguiense]MBP2329872.1 hypothetical protein [Kibdelosporangium banguiense]